MEQIIITKPDGSTYPLASKRTATEIKSAKQSWALLADDVVGISIESPFSQTYGIGDHFTVFGRAYKLNRLPKVKKTGMHAFSYDLEFEGIQYDLLRATYNLTIDTTNNQLQDVQADTLTGNLRRFATVLISNANRVFPNTWVLGSCPETIEDKTLTFGEGDNCLSVLQTLCTEFGVEFEIVQSNGKFTINFVSKVGQIFPFTFEFGKGKGLYSLDRQNVDSSNIVTRLNVYGSTSNITNKYRASRLCLPGKTKAQSYIEKPEAVAKYGIYESTKYFDDIKPTFNGSITGLVSGSVLKFIDTKMFDLIEGCAAKVHFNTGNLAGYEFEVHAYDHATKTFTLVKQTDDRGDVFPFESSSAFQFAQGNEYKLLDIALPDIPYQNDAENKLNEQGNIYYDQNSQPKVQYGLSVTKSYLKTLVGDGTTGNIFAPGDYIPVKDSDIDVDKSVRIKSLTRNLLDEYEYTLTISDTVSTNITNRVISELVDIDKIITINNLKDPVRARANWRSSREVLNMVFDPEGDYYTDKIKPNSIDTLALSVGAKSMQFGLTNTVLEPNFNGNKNTIKVKGGVLTHYTINEESARSWVLADNTTTFDNDGQAYYIYAKCSKAGTNGSIVFSTAQIKVEQDAMFYHFWIGVVNSVDTELTARSVALSYGFTTVNGKFIKTGRIESADGLTYFDLDDSEIGGRIVFKSISGGKKTIAELEAATAVNSANLINESKKKWKPTTIGETYVWGNPSQYIESGKIYTLVTSLVPQYGTYVFSVKGIGSETQLITRFTGSSSTPVTESYTFTATISGVLQAQRLNSVAYESGVEWVKLVQGLSASLEHEYSMVDVQRDLLETKAKTDNFTSINGGLVLASLIKLLDGGVERAGINGIVDKDNHTSNGEPAFWCGGSFADALAGLANVILRHRGEHKLGDLRIGQEGSLAVVNADGEEITKLIRENVPLLQTLISGNQDTTRPFARTPVSNNGNYGWKRIGSSSQDQVATTAILTVLNDGTKLTISEGTYIYVSCGTNAPTTSGELAQVQVELQNTTINKSYVIGTYIHGSGVHNSGISASTKTINISGSQYNMPAGSYRIVVKDKLLEQTRVGAETWSEWYFDGGNLSANLIKTANQSIFGRGLATIFDANNYLHYGWNKPYDATNPSDPERYPLLSMRGKVDMPGVLAEYTIGFTGTIKDSHGAKAVPKEALRQALGKYRVFHNIGHDDYRVQISNMTGFFLNRIITKAIDYVDIEFVNHSNSSYVDTDFMIILTGRS